MPPTRALVGNGVLIGRLQQGFPSSPGVCGLTRLQNGCFRVHEASEMRRVEVTLRGDPTGTDMPALVEWLLDHDPTVTAPRQFGPLGIQLADLPASACSQTG